jgi:hypothetical protein
MTFVGTESSTGEALMSSGVAEGNIVLRELRHRIGMRAVAVDP